MATGPLRIDNIARRYRWTLLYVAFALATALLLAVVA
jgi:hypothetical protein